MFRNARFKLAKAGLSWLVPPWQVGPTGVHLEKDNVFGSRAYAGGGGSGQASSGPASGLQASSDQGQDVAGSQVGAATGTGVAGGPNTAVYGPIVGGATAAGARTYHHPDMQQRAGLWMQAHCRSWTRQQLKVPCMPAAGSSLAATAAAPAPAPGPAGFAALAPASVAYGAPAPAPGPVTFTALAPAPGSAAHGAPAPAPSAIADSALAPAPAPGASVASRAPAPAPLSAGALDAATPASNPDLPLLVAAGLAPASWLNAPPASVAALDSAALGALAPNSAEPSDEEEDAGLAAAPAAQAQACPLLAFGSLHHVDTFGTFAQYRHTLALRPLVNVSIPFAIYGEGTPFAETLKD